MKDASDGLRIEDMLGPELEDYSDIDQELAQTGPVNFQDEKNTFNRDEIDLKIESKIRHSARNAAHPEDEKKKALSNTLNPRSVLMDIPVTLNKRKGSAQTDRKKRSTSRPTVAKIDGDESVVINFSAFTRLEPKKLSKKTQNPKEPIHARTRSSFVRKGAAQLTPFMSSLEPEFLSLFAKVEGRGI